MIGINVTLKEAAKILAEKENILQQENRYQEATVQAAGYDTPYEISFAQFMILFDGIRRVAVSRYHDQIANGKDSIRNSVKKDGTQHADDRGNTSPVSPNTFVVTGESEHQNTGKYDDF